MADGIMINHDAFSHGGNIGAAAASRQGSGMNHGATENKA